MSEQPGPPRLQDLDPERYRRCSDLAERLRELPPGELAAALEALAEEDRELRPFLEELLRRDADPETDRWIGEVFAAAAADVLSSETEAELSPLPERIGRYEILGRLGAGGMGLVLEGWDERLGRRIAIKTVSPQLAARPPLRARLEREARAAATLSHPGIVTVHSIEEDGDTLFLTMELVEGETLAQCIPDGGLELDSLMDWGLQLADAVAAAHARGIVHRDLKPANVVVTPDGRIKVLDFGLALLAKAPGVDADQGLVTQPGQVLGTPASISPEQLQGASTDLRTDVWSLGIVLHEMAVGRRPFTGDSDAALAAAILRDVPPPIAQQRESLPPAWSQLIARCLEKSSSLRPANARELHQELRALQAPSSLSSGPRAALSRGRLPAPRSSFVGRDRELAELGKDLEMARLVTVTGVGGSGKTRFVLEHARQQRENWPGGAWFCDLSDVHDGPGIARAVASALDVPLGPGDPVQQLGHAIAGRGRCLILLDNFEQVVDEAEGSLGAWLERCSEASFVVTSREVLRLAGELVLVLEPLPTDGAGIDLFVERATAQQRDFALTEQNRGEVEQLVELLDGLPLAIELAAARMRVLTPTQLLENLRDRFRLLVAPRGAQRRQGTLKATIDWSWELLEPWEQAALAQCSVFEGGFTLAAAEAVLDLAPWPDAPWAMDAVQGLVDKSLLWRRSGARVRGAAAEPRFGTYVSIHEYAAEKLRTDGALAADASGADASLSAEERHGAYFAGFGSDEALAGLHLRGGLERRRAVGLELDNLVAACRRAVARGDGETAVGAFLGAWGTLRHTGPSDLACSLGREALAVEKLSGPARLRALHGLGDALRSIGRGRDGGELHQEALVLAREQGERLQEGSLLTSLGILEVEMGRSEEARALYEQALKIAREVGDRRTQGAALANLGVHYWGKGRLDLAREHYEQSLEIAREVGNLRSECTALSNLGILHVNEGRPDVARELYEAASAIARKSGERRLVGHSLGHLSLLHQEQGRLEKAREGYEQALAIHREVGERRKEGVVLGNLGMLLHELGRLEDARARQEEALAVHRELGNRRFEGIALAQLGNLQLAQGCTDAARDHHERALAIARELNDRRSEGEALGYLGQVSLEEAALEEAAEELESALGISREIGDTRLEGLLLSCRGRLFAESERTSAARGAFERAKELLREQGADLELGKLAARRGRLELAEDDREAARASLAEAVSVAERSGVGPRSELGRELESLRDAMA